MIQVAREPPEVRYRCVVCSDLVRIGEGCFMSLITSALSSHWRGESTVDGNFIALVCAACQAKPEETVAALAEMKREPEAASP